MIHMWPDRKPAVTLDDHGWLCSDSAALLAASIPRTGRCGVVEIGSWLGKSTRFLLSLNPELIVYCVDTWNGSPEHHRRAEWQEKLTSLQSTFMANCWGNRSRIVMVRADSATGLPFLGELGLRPRVVYVDGDHSALCAASDILNAARLFPCSYIVVDDCDRRDVQQGVSMAEPILAEYTVEKRRKAWRYIPPVIESLPLGTEEANGDD